MRSTCEWKISKDQTDAGKIGVILECNVYKHPKHKQVVPKQNLKRYVDV